MDKEEFRSFMYDHMMYSPDAKEEMIEALSRFEIENNIDLDQMLINPGCSDQILDFNRLFRYFDKTDNVLLQYALFSYDYYLRMKKEMYQPANSFMEFGGTDEEILNQFSQFISQEDAKKLYRYFFSSTYYINSFSEKSRRTLSSSYSLISNKYNIRIKTLSLIAIALLLDIKFTLGASSAALMILGLDGKAISRVDATLAEVCLILEAMNSEGRLVNDSILTKFRGECVHNNLDCNYKQEGKCCITVERIKETLEELCRNNVFSKVGDFYRYNN